MDGGTILVGCICQTICTYDHWLAAPAPIHDDDADDNGDDDDDDELVSYPSR